MPQPVPTDLDTRPVAVLGAGTLGRRIALMFAAGGARVRITDASPEQCAEAVRFVQEQLPELSRELGGQGGTAEVSPDLAAAVDGAWLVVEAVPERLELKTEVFGELDRLAPPDAVLASNSSSYRTSEMLGRVSRPDRVVNMHFYMPPRARAVEIMSCGRTDPAVIALLVERVPRYGLVPFEVRTQSTGFIYNRIWAAIKREALSVAAEGVATPEEIDRIFRLTLGTQRGPFRMMDAVGLDVVLDIEEHYAVERPYLPEAPRQLLRELVERGDLGAKTGRGFYDDPAEG